MSSNIAQTILVTTKCSGGCQHCPFSSADMEQLFLKSETIQTIVNQTTSELVVLSGGEPFEHPDISSILTGLSRQNKPFRIATGGFLDLKQWIDQLKQLSYPSGPLEGISMGTDVLSTRVNNKRWNAIWKNNIQLLSEYQISYSLTFTIGNDLNFTQMNLPNWIDLSKSKPEFLYLRYSHEHLRKKWILDLNNAFGNIPIIQDDLL